MKANFGIMARLEGERIPRPARGGLYAQRAHTAMTEFMDGLAGEAPE